jgi:hypothetical protein
MQITHKAHVQRSLSAQHLSRLLCPVLYIIVYCVAGLPGDSKDSYGFRQPNNVLRVPLNPLATLREIRRVESTQPESSLSAAARRINFKDTSINYNKRMELESKGIMQALKAKSSFVCHKVIYFIYVYISLFVIQIDICV